MTGFPFLPTDPGDRRSLLCLSLACATIEDDLACLRQCGRYADLIELRVDCLAPPERGAAVRFPSLTGLPAIMTVRREKDGGRYQGPEAERMSLITRLIPGGFSAVDLEDDLNAPSLDAAARSAGCSIIRSLHDTKGVPNNLESRLSRLARNPGELPKAAVTPRGAAELAILLKAFQATKDLNKILFGMGEPAVCTRVLASKLGSRLCYSSPAGGDAAAENVDPRTLCEMYRFRSIGSETAVFGVIGNPIAHSLSPIIHNKGFAALDMDAVYLPFLVDEAEAFFEVADLLDLRGLSVTVPHKEAVLPFLSRRDASVEKVGACNTVVRDPETRDWVGINTDVEGFLKPLRETLGGAIPPHLRAVVIGAGGAARAVVTALVGEGAEVLVLNRTAERARRLADGFGVRWGTLDETGAGLMAGYCDLVVQTTSVGMAPFPQSDPFPLYPFSGREIVYDLVYNPPVTRFLSRAREAGCVIVEGKRMLIAQAYTQFRLFSGTEYPALTENLSHDDIMV